MYRDDKELFHTPSCPDDCPACDLIAARKELHAIDFEMWRRQIAESH
jgi:hypothetical protein